MKIKIILLSLLGALGAHAQGTAFTYEGRLADNGNPANGIYDLRFTLYNAAAVGSPVGNAITNAGTSVSDGRFTVLLDFGATVFDGNARWLEIGVRTNGSVVPYTALMPRQAVTATPYAITASNLTGSLPAGQLNGTLPSALLSGAYSNPVTFANAADQFAGAFTGNGSGLTALNAGNVTTGTLSAARIDAAIARASDIFPTVLANDGAGSGLDADFLDGLNSTAFATVVHAHAAGDIASGMLNDARLSTNVALLNANQTFTGSNNFMGALVATNANSWFAGNGAGLTNLAPANLGAGTAPISIAGNAATATTASVANGVANNAVTAPGIAPGQVVKGLNGLHDAVTLAAGPNVSFATNANTLTISAAGGGASGSWSMTGNAGTTPSTHFLGTTDTNALEFKVDNQRGLRLEPTAYPDTVNVIGGSAANVVGGGAVGATIGGGGAGNFGGVAYTNRVEANFASIGGGGENMIQPNAASATISGGFLNTIQLNAFSATIGGGYGNAIQTNAIYAAIGGGVHNTVQPNAYYATIPGGLLNSATNYAFAAGTRAKANHTGTFVWADSQDADFASMADNQFLIRAAGGVGVNNNNPATALDVNGTVTATSFSGNGADLTSLNASNLTGSVPSAALTLVPAGNLTGTVIDARLTPNVALRGGDNAFTGNQTIAGSVVVDQANQNTGAVYSASLTFGSPGGEGIASKRTSGVNQWGLDFYTGYQPRMTIANNGSVGIGTATPQAALDVAGTVKSGKFDVNGSGDDNTDPLWIARTNVGVNQSELRVNIGDDFGPSAGATADAFVVGVTYYLDQLWKPVLSVFSTGNVGIGTTTPVTALEVNGTVTATGFSGPVAANQITGTLAAANIGAGTITGSKLAPGAAAANLDAAGQSGVASGGLVLSATENAALVNAGYVRIGGTMTTPEIWQQRVNGAPPSARDAHTAVWTGSEMIVWGGEQDSLPGSTITLNDGGRYNPVADTWTPITTTGAPSGRKEHTAVWTGTAMIIWGGRGSALFNTGGGYDPAADSWMQMPTDGAPAGRRSHTAVWTGSEMIVWGGQGVGVYYSDGGRYNPAANTWTLIPNTLANTPAARNGHTAVWTGGEMIVWGGVSSLGVHLADGERYNPAENTWMAVSTAGTLAGRNGHTAVWTGSEMIVWGGRSFSGYLKTGGRYTPASDGWTQMSAGGAPAARVGHTAVWTGGEMIVWGGLGNNSSLDDGGRYSPAANSWAAVSTAGAPSERTGHTAVWTGTGMIVWGGQGLGGNSGGYLNDTFSCTPGHSLYLYQRP